jgi:hypothetical protein
MPAQNERQEQLPQRVYSDFLLEANATVEGFNFRVGPIYRDGQETGVYRAVRRRTDGVFEMRKFANRDEALAWGLEFRKKRQ